MQEIFNFVIELLTNTLKAMYSSVTHNWLPLSLAIITAAAMKVFIDAEKLKQALLRKPKVSTLASVLLGAFTPLCACGTMAVIIGLLTTALPWGPIMAFLTSSPLMSPDGFIMLAGIIGVRFAVALTVASLVIGLGSGYATHLIEKTGYLKNQTRFSPKHEKAGCGCSTPVPETLQLCCEGVTSIPVRSSCCSKAMPVAEPVCGCTGESTTLPVCGCTSSENSATSKPTAKTRFRVFAEALYSVGIKQILLFFAIFVGIGYLINSFVPTDLIVALFSADSIFSVPLAALIGLPLYVSGESAIPLIQALMKGGAGGGAMLAFMITGPATSAWVIAGISSFMRRRVVGLYLGFILIGGILLGYVYDILIAMGL